MTSFSVVICEPFGVNIKMSMVTFLIALILFLFPDKSYAGTPFSANEASTGTKTQNNNQTSLKEEQKNIVDRTETLNPIVQAGDRELNVRVKLREMYEFGDRDPPTELNMIYGDQKNNQDDELNSFKLTAENSELRLKLSMMERYRFVSEMELASLRSEMGELRKRLNKSLEDVVTQSEIARIMENTNSALRLENQMMSSSFNKEQIQTRRLKAEIVQLNRKLNNSDEIDVGNQQCNSSGCWDVRETVWNGERWLQNWDGRQPKNHDSNVSATRVIFFIRHGHYEYSVPEEAIEMTELGKMQMDWAGRGLSLLKYHWNRTLIHSSKRRTQQAAQIIANYIPGFKLQPSDLIWSCAYDNDSLRRQEAFKQFIYRASPRQKRTSYELVVTHSSIIRYFVERALQVPQDAISMPLVHGSITRIEIQGDGRVVLREFGEYSHLPKNLITMSNAKWLFHDTVSDVNSSSTKKPPIGGSRSPAPVA